MKIVKKILFVIIGILVLVAVCSFFYGAHLYIRLDPFVVKENNLSGNLTNLLMDEGEAVQKFNLSENESKNYIAPFSFLSLTSVDRYFNDKKDRGGFMPNPALLFFKLFISMEKHVMCSDKISEPLFYKVSEINETWFSMSGIHNAIAYDKNILPLLKFDNYPLDLAIVKGNTCKGEVLKKFTLSYDMGSLTLSEKKANQENKTKLEIPENKIIPEAPHN